MQVSPSSLALADRLLRHKAQFIQVITLLLNDAKQSLIVILCDDRLPGHQPDVIALGSTYDCELIFWIYVDDSIFGLDGPNKLHTPNRIARAFSDKSCRLIGLALTFKTAFIKGKSCGDPSIHGLGIAFNRIVGICFNEGRNIGYDKPITGEPVQIA